MTEEDVGAWMMHCHILQHMIMGYGLEFSSLSHFFRFRMYFVLIKTRCDDDRMQTVWVFGSADQILARYPSTPYIDGYLTYGGDAYGNDSYDPLSQDRFGSRT